MKTEHEDRAVSRVEEYDGSSSLKEAEKLLIEFRRFALNNENRLSRALSGSLIDIFGKAVDLVRSLTLENERLLGKLSMCSNVDRLEVLITSTPVPYSEVVKSKVARFEKKGGDNVVLIKGFQKEDSDTIKQKFLRGINPINDRIRFQTMRKLRNGGMVAVLATKEDRDRLLMHDINKSEDIVISIPVRRRPRILLMDVPRELEVQDLVQLLYRQNGDLIYGDGVMNEDMFVKDFQPLYKTVKKRELFVNWVVEVDPKMRRRVLELNKLYLEYRCCKIKDYWEITKCYRCQVYGHIVRFCKEEREICYKCGEEGHRSKDCKIEEIRKLCIPCKKMGKECGHYSGDRFCFAYQVAITRYKNSIDYG
ncbi:uncharacterized protein LOC111615709 [Centruroides sculpturatus]|uniref:uncharacterized protein LOC111615709 n=1 Tax=Centruroides sculpturatus TaxID=218467 RepID=UPI000C6C9812|nr:uncharacterized protein LOC111615709 [Centruroides sculpturatus]